MAGSIGGLRERVKGQLGQYLPREQVEHEARACGHRWRKRKLGPWETIHLLLLQLLAFNTALSAVRHLAGDALSAGALCQARARLPLELLRRCCGRVSGRVAEAARRLDWCGREVLAADAVCYYTPDTPPLRRWLGSKNRFGFPLVKVVSLLSLGGGAMLRQVPLPHRRGEAPLLGRLLGQVKPAAVLVMDRAFASFANLHAVLRHQADAVVRLRKALLARKGTAREVIARLGRNDHLVCWRRPQNRCSLLSRLRWRALPQRLVLRQVSFTVKRRGYRTRRVSVITTLLDPALYPAEKLAELYHRRWEIETQFRHLKQTLNWEFLRCRSVQGVKKELLLRQIAYNVLRGVIAERAAGQAADAGRISFADALRWLLYCPVHPETEEATPLMTLTTLLTIPHRPGRFEPRRVKRQDKNYLPLNCTRREARKKAA